MIKIKIKCFSQVKYSLGVDELTFELEDGTSVSDLEKIVREKALGKLDGVTLRTAINRKYISDNANKDAANDWELNIQKGADLFVKYIDNFI